ncbi:MAG: hypothetical protein FJ104_09205, partial [Deltaproteobacteria bacterium]|nr:hypothetical protein [Deltaproteobacteria bacterium]
MAVSTAVLVVVLVAAAVVPTAASQVEGAFQRASVAPGEVNFLTFPYEIEDGGGPGGPPPVTPLDGKMTAVFSNIVVTPGAGVIGGDLLEFDVTVTNTSPTGGPVLTAFAFQSKFSESPALASRIGDKLFYATLDPDAGHAAGPMGSVKKNGTSNGLFSGRWKGICLNSSEDFLPEFNAGLEDESLECAGSRADTNGDGEPELVTAPLRGLAPGASQTVRLRLDSGTTDGALHVVKPNTLRGRATSTPVIGPNGIEYLVPSIDNAGVTDPNVTAIPDFADNKVLRNADGTFNPTFAPAAEDFRLDGRQYLTLPRVNRAFTDILGRNHTCGTYGLDLISGVPCSGTPGESPTFGFLGVGDLVPGAQNFAALLQGFGEYVLTGDPDDPYAAPNFPYGVPCVNPNAPDGLRCGARPFTPVAEFYAPNPAGPAGSVVRQMVAGSYGALGTPAQYTATIDSLTADDLKQEIVPEEDEGGPCEEPNPNRPKCAALGTSASVDFHDLTVVEGAGINGGDAVEFTLSIKNTSTNPAAYLTAFNFQTKRRSLADIGVLDGFTQDRRDVRVHPGLPR